MNVALIVGKFMVNEYAGMLSRHKLTLETSPVPLDAIAGLAAEVAADRITKHEMRLCVERLITDPEMRKRLDKA